MIKQEKDNSHIVYIIVDVPNVTTPCYAYIYRKIIT